jgi:hypothetical protein
VGCVLALGSSTSTTPSQNAIRNRKRMTPIPAALLKAAFQDATVAGKL